MTPRAKIPVEVDPAEAEELGITYQQLMDLRTWNYHDQPHYGLATRRALARFQVAYQRYLALGKSGYDEKKQRGIVASEAWIALLAARELETGVSYYLSPKQYKEKVDGNVG